jgi:hypothetical protein
MAAAPTCIVAYTGEGPHQEPVLRAAVAAARKARARLILYDADAASLLASPRRTWWSADADASDEDEAHGRLGPPQLEAAGRPALADAVLEARAAGLDAFGWLPNSRDAKHLAEYATQQRADLLVVPGELDRSGLAGWIDAAPEGEKSPNGARRSVLVINADPAPAP